MKPFKWTDAELLSHTFKITGRPDEDDTLSQARPGPDAAITFLRSYNITPPKDLPNRMEQQPWVWCALCQAPTHWIGWEAEVVEPEGARRVLIGQHCAKKNGEALVRIASNEFESRQLRSEVLRSRKAVLEQLPITISALEGWKAEPSVTVVSAWRSTLMTVAADKYRYVVMASEAAPPGMLLEVDVRDYAAEQRRDERTGRRTNDPIFRREYQNVGTLPCRALYWSAPPEDRIAALSERATKLYQRMQAPTDGVATKALRELIAEAGELVRKAQAIERDFSKLSDALSPQSIDELVSWFNKLPKREYPPEGKYARHGSHLIYYPVEGRQIIGSIPKAAAITVPAEVYLLEMALTQGWKVTP